DLDILDFELLEEIKYFDHDVIGDVRERLDDHWFVGILCHPCPNISTHFSLCHWCLIHKKLVFSIYLDVDRLLRLHIELAWIVFRKAKSQPLGGCKHCRQHEEDDQKKGDIRHGSGWYLRRSSIA